MGVGYTATRATHRILRAKVSDHIYGCLQYADLLTECQPYNQRFRNDNINLAHQCHRLPRGTWHCAMDTLIATYGQLTMAMDAQIIC